MKLTRILTATLIGVCLLAMPLAPAAVTDAVAECSAAAAADVFSTELAGSPWCPCDQSQDGCPWYCKPPK